MHIWEVKQKKRIFTSLLEVVFAKFDFDDFQAIYNGMLACLRNSVIEFSHHTSSCSFFVFLTALPCLALPHVTLRRRRCYCPGKTQLVDSSKRASAQHPNWSQQLGNIKLEIMCVKGKWTSPFNVSCQSGQLKIVCTIWRRY